MLHDELTQSYLMEKMGLVIQAVRLNSDEHKACERGKAEILQTHPNLERMISREEPCALDEEDTNALLAYIRLDTEREMLEVLACYKRGIVDGIKLASDTETVK